MSTYTIGEIVVWLVLAAVLGAILGWVLRELTVRARSHRVVALEEIVPVAEPTFTPGRFTGSARPLEGGAAPDPGFVVKGNEKSMIYHPPESPSYGRTVAQTWFRTEEDAVAAGFRKPKNA